MFDRFLPRYGIQDTLNLELLGNKMKLEARFAKTCRFNFHSLCSKILRRISYMAQFYIKNSNRKGISEKAGRIRPHPRDR